MRPLALALGLVILATPAAADRLRLLVPAYQYPTEGTLWSELTEAAARVSVTAILNPDNGPGAVVDPDYVAVVNALRAAGGRVIGYVFTQYTARDTGLVLADARRYASLYAIDGIFVDEMTDDAGAPHVGYYADLAAALRAFRPEWSVTGNPGTLCAPEYVTVAGLDRILTFEDGAGYLGWEPDPWMLAQPPGRFASLLHSSGSVAMRAALAHAADRNVGAIYVTDDVLPNPWDALPSYWEEEVAVIETTHVAGVEPQAPAVSRLALVANPARGDVRFRCAAARAGRRLVIHDLAGRRVRAIDVPSGATAVAWDARDAAGARVAAGLYLARLAAGEGARDVVRFVLTR